MTDDTRPEKPDAADAPDTTSPVADLIAELVDSYDHEDLLQHINKAFLPSRERVIQFIELLRHLIFPGFFDTERVTQDNAREHVRGLLTQVHHLLHDQITQALCYERNITRENAAQEQAGGCEDKAKTLTAGFLHQLPQLRHMLGLDVQAAFDGDPAAVSTDEAIFSYPGIDAIFIYRAAHELLALGVPLVPRIMTEYAHNQTGIDIHPGATIGQSFFIDHGTGVVVGESTTIGDHVKLYQGVTLGALSTKGGQSWRGMKRHPTLRDHVTVYPNATILGGETVIGEGCVVNGGAFLTHSVEAGHTVRVEHPQPQLRAQRQTKKKTGG